MADREDQPDSKQTAGTWNDVLFGPYGVYTFVLSLGITLFAINQFVVAAILPTVAKDIGGFGYYAWTFSLFAVGAIMGAASAGPLRDAFGARNSYAGAGLVLGVGLLGAALAPDMPTLVAFRLVQGIGGGALSSQAYGLVATAYPAHLRSRVLGVISTLWGIATVAGPAFGGVFAEFGAWRYAFGSLVPLAAIFAVLAWRYVDAERGHGRLSEVPYWRLAFLGLAVLLLSATTLTGETWVRVALIVASIAISVLAFARDASAERPMFPRRATAVLTELGAMYWIIFLVSIVVAFVNTYTTFYLQALHGLTPLAAVYVMAIQSFLWTGSALVVASISRPFETASTVIGLALILIATLGIAATVAAGPVVAIAIAIGLCGTGIGFMNNPAIQRVMAAAPEDEKHVAGTSVQTVRNIGISFGAALSGMVAAAAGLTDGAGPAVIAHAMNWVYGVNVAFALAALAISIPLIARRRIPRQRHAD